MVINEELLSTMIEQYPGWDTGPEEFLGFITMVSQLMAANAQRWDLEAIDEAGFVKELGELMIRELKVDIRPYKNFEEVRQYCALRESVLKKLEGMIGNMKREDRLFELTEEAGILPSEETMHVAILNDLFARAAIDKLRPYVTFI